MRKLTILVLAFVFLSCTQKPQAPADSGAASARTGGGGIVNIAIWANYLSPDLVTEFEKKTGTKVQLTNYASNEELLAKLQAGASGYDMVVPSDYMVFAMIKLGLIRELDYTQLPNAKLLDPKVQHKSYDPDNKFSVPYDWGTTGIAVNRDLYKGEIKSWKQLFDNPALNGKFSLLDDVRETLGAALKSLGLSLNSRNPADIQNAKAVLLKARKGLKAFTSEPLMPLVNGELPVAHAYLPDALQARKKAGGGKIEYVIPEEGATLWIDNLVIPTGAQHLQAAHAFINFLLEPRSDLSTVMNIFVAPANRETFPLLPADLQKNLALFPPESVLAKCEMIQDLGDSLAQWDRTWTEVKAAN
jgi:spermidine/putrescine transport system substrate-binding protein